MDIIQQLPDSVANQIAAGEVIQRPASVLKELVENAIDAGATHIQIIVKEAGKNLIQVIDNGKGMSPTDARISFERHATSKIKDANDLFNLFTLGFRGEALASIAAVAQVELRTRREGDELGTLIEIAASQVTAQEVVTTPVGTSILVKNLFYNLPARRRFLKTNATELKHLLTEFYRIVLVYPEVAFTFHSDGEELYRLPESNLKQRIERVFVKSSRKSFVQQLLPVETSTSIVSVKGFIGKPEYAEKGAPQYLFANQRFMRHPYFHKAIMTAFQGMLHGEALPSYFLYLEVNPEMIDVNIHPTKTEIKFIDEQAIWSILMAGVKESLGKFNVVPSIDFETEGAVDLPTLRSVDHTTIRPPQMQFNPNYSPFNTSGGGGSSYKRTPIDWESLYAGFEKAGDKPSHPIGAEEVPTEEQSATPLFTEATEELKADILQLKARYILTPVKSGLMVIDQQRAHLRILYDQYLSKLAAHMGCSQQLLFPETLEVGVENVALFEELIPELEGIGFDLNQLERATFSIHGIPSELQMDQALECLKEIVASLSDAPTQIERGHRERIALSLAKAAGVKRGQALMPDEMHHIIEQLFACPHHAQDPEGKAVMAIIDEETVESYFK